MTISAIAAFITEISVLIGVVVWVVAKLKNTSEGIKCLLRSEMLQIYYRHIQTKEVRQYEYENFVMLYNAYKALHGNSFMDKIYKEVTTWKVIT